MKDDRVYLLHVIDAVDRILRYTADGRAKFFSNDQIQDAVIRNLEVIGEAVKNLSPSITEAHLDVPWRQIAGMRDVLIHQYFGVKLETVWAVVESSLPHLRDKAKEILDSESK